MTGKNTLIRILRGRSLHEDIDLPRDHGFIKAVKPSYDGKSWLYNSEVVCFTESPIFALDFFRYRSYERWKSDQLYGIGFSKEYLVCDKKVRPVIYLDGTTNSQLLYFFNQIIDENYKIEDKAGNAVDNKELLMKLKPLLFPLMEDTPLQGFMWEREWRYPDSNGLIFPYSAIKVICCPAGERDEIEDILEDYRENIEIVESWREYNDVTSYLKRRNSEVDSEQLDKISEITDIKVLEELQKQNNITLSALEAHYDTFSRMVSGLDENGVGEMIMGLRQKSVEIGERMEAVLGGAT
jgi:hypothetical protein